MNKKPIAIIKLTLLANKASPSPLLGQALGQHGINIMEFCKIYNNFTKNLKDTIYVPTLIYLYSKDNYKVIIKTPSTSYLIKQIANISKGYSLNLPNNQKNYIYLKELYHLAIFKKCDKILNYLNIKSLCKTLIGTVKSISLNIKIN